MAVVRVTFILPWLSLYSTAHGSAKWSERAKVFYPARPVNKSEISARPEPFLRALSGTIQARKPLIQSRDR